jgi:hypothetical protein
MPVEEIERVLLESIEEHTKKGNAALEAARAMPPPTKIEKPRESPSAGKIAAGDVNYPLHIDPDVASSNLPPEPEATEPKRPKESEDGN